MAFLRGNEIRLLRTFNVCSLMLTIREVCCPCAHPAIIIFLWVEHITTQGRNDITVDSCSAQTAYKKSISCCGLTQRAQTPGGFRQQQAAISHVSEDIRSRLWECLRWSGPSVWSPCWTPRWLQRAYVRNWSGIFLSQSRLSECGVVRQDSLTLIRFIG